jgi:hypothetical protein
MEWLLQKDPKKRPTLGQAIGVAALKKHAAALAKGYRPISVPERQRRAEGKDLEQQVYTVLTLHTNCQYNVSTAV